MIRNSWILKKHVGSYKSGSRSHVLLNGYVNRSVGFLPGTLKITERSMKKGSEKCVKTTCQALR